MSELLEIRATYDNDTITVYQAYNKEIGLKASQNNKFVEPFSFSRMTWIKPSFLWMMERSNWGQKPNQEITLAIKIKRDCFENALSEAILTSPNYNVYANKDEWKQLFKNSRVHVQWDPERDIRGSKLTHRSIQIGVSRHLVKDFNDNWIVSIDDISSLVSKIHKLKLDGSHKAFLPKENIYILPTQIQKKLGIQKNLNQFD